MSNLSFMEKMLEGVEVEWKTLGELTEYSKTRICFDKLDKSNYVGVDNLLQNWAGKKESTYVPTEGNLIEYQSGDILIGNIRPYLKKIWHADRIGGTNGDVLVIHLTDETITPRYLYQILADDKFFDYNMRHSKGAKMPRGNKTKIMEYPIPIPSLNIQTEIVRILDAFTELTAKLTAKLTAEFTARKKQYNYYRDQLLNFEESEVEWKTLGEMCTISVGQAPNVNELGNYPFVNAGTTPSGYLSTYNTESDVITTPSRGQGGIGYVGYQKNRFWCGPLCYRIRSKSELITTRFLFYVMSNSMKNIIGLANMAGVPALNKKDLGCVPQ
ncbi:MULTISPECIES: restriction endonuclease subunit S [Photorhabdus]|uniref:restriction endonuclease subunit S n=1 Tax=Photorhabdus TaxID=29487 RepID=UPI000DCBF2DC|nr:MULTISPECIES: restriction endonuclease subunit S [Photorhabdus]AXG44554.1 restriction endonuclease subunit S [Photorhabdus laumondii subsp. laumondii]NDL19021.1 restriction endonuclease subunit S [Photorhabdus laumondii subsp. laumondii]NDL50947.1 restriction endonuclease subunit S [Photorhabdus laumondii subsp. laumondii]NDL55408.1 restriction endonuclease subunit S [Photorhabdus laumondii subsp. laumondii]RAW77572.1 type I restriction endonuclease subunit S [Photorhabdus sp. S5P8-50]